MRILYLDLDALTPSHLSCYGYARRTSPTLDALAAQGMRSTGVYCSDAPCLPSRTAFYAGRFGIQTGVVGHGGTAAEPKREGTGRSFRDRFDQTGLAKQLQSTGFHTAMISPFGQRHAAHWFYAGFNEIHNTGKGGHESAEEVTPVIQKWLADHARDDQWYLHVNFWDIHTPYRAPMAYGNPFENEPLPPHLVEAWERHRQDAGPHSALDLGMYCDGTDAHYPRVPDRLDSEAKLKQWIDGYDTAIRYVDDQMRLILDTLNAAGVLEDTAIIVSADHGENHGELGIYGEHATADHGTCNIPLIIRWPGATAAAGTVDDRLHYHLDLAPTLLELLGRKDETPAIWDGESFAPTVQTGEAAGRDQLVISQCAHVCQRSVRWDRWLYMRTYHDGFHGFPQEMLFDLEADPMEQHDLAAERADLCREGAWRLAQWHDAQMWRMAEHASDVVDPLWTVIREGGPLHARLTQPGTPGSWEGLETYAKRLETTGRADAAAKLRARWSSYARWLGRAERVG